MKISDFIPKTMNTIINKTKRAAREIIRGDDPEAVHDTRVGIRKIRSVLREIKNVYDRYYVDKLRKDFKSIFSKTSVLRDEEVILELLNTIEISDANKTKFNSWVRKRKTKERELRKDVVEFINSGVLNNPVKILNAVLTLPLKPKKDDSVEEFAFKRINKIRQKVLDMAEHCIKNIDDIELSHDLRILCKRLRYTIEYFKKVIPATYSKIGRYAKKMQNVLGDMHDYDVLIELINSEELDENLKNELLQVCQVKRDELCEKSKKALIKLPDNIK